jgi:hypothetical protein
MQNTCCKGQNSVMFVIILSQKRSHDKDFTGHQLCQLPDGIIANQTSFRYRLILTVFILVGLAGHLNHFLPQKSL